MATTPLPRDFKEFLRLLNEKKVENLINIDHLKQNKLAAGRNKDLADLENLP